MAIVAGGSVPMARVSRNDYTLIGRLLDEGSMGIIVPMVNTQEDAQAVADACRLPPVGKRSWGWGGATRLGGDYSDRINDELFVAVQIESIQAVENAEAIMATPGMDGCWIGPADLALSMGIHPSNTRTTTATRRRCRACWKPATTPERSPDSPRSTRPCARAARRAGLPLSHQCQRHRLHAGWCRGSAEGAGAHGEVGR